MTGSDKLLKNTMVYAAGNLGSRVLSFLLVPLFSFYLSKEDLGAYDLITTSIILLVPFVSIQVSDAVYRWLLDATGDSGRTTAISNGLTVLFVMFIPFSLLFLLANVLFTIPYAYYSLALLLLSALSVMCQQILRGLGKNKLYSLSGILYTFLLVLLNVVFLWYTHLMVKGLLIASIIANIIMILTILLLGKFHRHLHPSAVSREAIKSMIAYSGPLIPNTISWWLINEVNRFIILYALGLEFNGVFAMANRFPSLILMVNSIFMLAWQDHALGTTATDKGKQDATRIFNTFMVLELSLAIVLISVTRFMIQFLVDEKFYSSWQYIPLLYLAVVFSSFASFLGVGYLNAKKTKGIFYTTIIGSVVNIIVTVGSIRYIGLYAPTLGMTAGFLAMWLVRIRQTRAFYRIDFHLPTFLALLSLSILFSIFIRTDNIAISLLLIVAALAIFIYCNRLLLQSLFAKLRQLVFKKTV